MSSSKSYLNIIGPALKRIRLSKRPPITQEQLATLLELQDWKIGRFGISKIERMERQITDKELIILARVLEIDVNSFFEDLGT